MDATTTAAVGLPVVAAAARSVDDVLVALAASRDGLSAAEAAQRLERDGSNAVRTHHVGALSLLLSQLRSPLLLLLGGTAALSAFFGQGTDAVIIGVILAGSIGLGFVNEYRAAQAAQALHSQLRHTCTVHRDGRATSIDVVELVAGDVVDLELGEVVPADLRLVSLSDLECDESVLTGESEIVTKSVDPVAPASALGDLTSCALMGTVVRSGSGRGVVVATGSRAEFGQVALQLGEREPETEFQRGLRDFSMLLVKVAAVLCVGILVINLALQRPFLEAVLFSLAIAVGISPQLLPAVVSTSLAAGSRALAREKVLVKRLVCIEDLGDVEVLFTDKTGTLTEGRISFMRAIGADATPSLEPVRAGLLCNEAIVEDGHAVSGNSLDVALWDSPASSPLWDDVRRWRRLDVSPFEHVSSTVTVLVRDPAGAVTLLVKGAPEVLLARCVDVTDPARAALAVEFSAGNRVVAVGRADVDAATGTVAGAGDPPLRLVGFLVFLDPPKASAAAALERLADLGIDVKVITGDNAVVAQKVCAELGLPEGATLTGVELDALDDDALTAAIPGTSVFARVSPEHKARVVRLHRRAGTGVAFLGDGVNDTLALHAADVGISVDSAADVAKDAADVILLEKDLDVLAAGVVEGRRVFANTIKYVLMGTSSNFGNMFSAAGASIFLTFLPMLPSQILLNNLLYDTSQLAIPTDNVDADQLLRPSHWDIAMIRRFMLFFGPISSVFDFLTFAIMIRVFDASPPEFRAGWFVESLATQTLVIFAIRTRRVPFFHSRPSRGLLLAAITVVAVGAALPSSPLSTTLGFAPLPVPFFATLVVMVVLYLVLIDVAKRWFFAHLAAPTRVRPPAPGRRVARRAARFSTHHPLTALGTGAAHRYAGASSGR